MANNMASMIPIEPGQMEIINIDFTPVLTIVYGTTPEGQKIKLIVPEGEEAVFTYTTRIPTKEEELGIKQEETIDKPQVSIADMIKAKLNK